MRDSHFVAGYTLSTLDDGFEFSCWRKGNDGRIRIGEPVLEGFHDAVGYGGGFDGGADVVGADDMGSG